MTTEHQAVPVYWSRQQQGVAVITIDRPVRLNALNVEVKHLIETAVTELSADPEVKVIILTGANDVFVAGTDIAEMVDMSVTDHTRKETDKVFRALRACPKPCIAAVERYALGGGLELALACDMIIAGESARFALPEIHVGIMPGAGGTQILPRILGKFRAMKMILTGEQVSAQQALNMGLLTEVVESGGALAAAEELAGTIASMPPLAVRAIKEVVQQGMELPITSALLLERKAFQILFDSNDQVEGMTAFLEKRQAQFTGN